MDRQSLLHEVNKLVSSGLRLSAIDLLTEYLNSYPTDPLVLRALGKIYLLEQETFSYRFEQFRSKIKTDELSLDEIAEEVEKVRQARYDACHN